MTPNNNTEGADPRPAVGGGSGKIVSEHAISRDGILTKYQLPIFYIACSPFLASVFFYFGFTRSEWVLHLVGAVFLACGIAALIYILKNMYRGVRRVLLTETGIQ